MNGKKCFSKCESLGFFFKIQLVYLVSFQQSVSLLHRHCISPVSRHRNMHTYIVTSTKKSVPSKILIKRGVVLGRAGDAVEKVPIRGWQREESGFQGLSTYIASMNSTALYRITQLRCDRLTCMLHASFPAERSFKGIIALWKSWKLGT